MKMNLLAAMALLVSVALHAEVQTIEVTVANPHAHDKMDEPVVVGLHTLQLPFEVASATVWDGTVEIPSQLDDFDRDNRPDELAFVIDLPATSTRTYKIILSSEPTNKTYPSRVYAEMLMRGDNGQHQKITSLTVPGNSDIYNLLHHHGPAFESELVAYRIYFDLKQTVDIYGKFNKGLEIEACQFYPTDDQLARGFGDDVLRVSGSAGVGALKGWNGQKATHIAPVETRTETVLATGPVRTVTDVDVRNWQYQGNVLNMKIRYILYAGHRDCEVQVRFDRPSWQETFAIGIQHIKESVSHADGKGLLACWGTDWPVNDTVKYAKETVGLAMSLPQPIVKRQADDGANYLYTVGLDGGTAFTYYITFTSMKETFGYKTPEAWFAFTEEWKKTLLQPVTIRITK